MTTRTSMACRILAITTVPLALVLLLLYFLPWISMRPPNGDGKAHASGLQLTVGTWLQTHEDGYGQVFTKSELQHINKNDVQARPWFIFGLLAPVGLLLIGILAVAKMIKPLSEGICRASIAALGVWILSLVYGVDYSEVANESSRFFLDWGVSVAPSVTVSVILYVVALLVAIASIVSGAIGRGMNRIDCPHCEGEGVLPTSDGRRQGRNRAPLIAGSMELPGQLPQIAATPAPFQCMPLYLSLCGLVLLCNPGWLLMGILAKPGAIEMNIFGGCMFGMPALLFTAAMACQPALSLQSRAAHGLSALMQLVFVIASTTHLHIHWFLMIGSLGIAFWCAGVLIERRFHRPLRVLAMIMLAFILVGEGGFLLRMAAKPAHPADSLPADALAMCVGLGGMAGLSWFFIMGVLTSLALQNAPYEVLSGNRPSTLPNGYRLTRMPRALAVVLLVILVLLTFGSVLIICAGPRESGGPSMMRVILVGLLYLSGIPWWAMLYRAWACGQDNDSKITPGRALGYLFIPLFNLYWFCRVVGGVPGRLNRLIERHGLPCRRMAQAPAVAFVIVHLLWALSMILRFEGDDTVQLIAVVTNNALAAYLCVGLTSRVNSIHRAIAATGQ